MKKGNPSGFFAAVAGGEQAPAPANLTIISATDIATVTQSLQERCPNGAHFTNGIYGLLAEKVVPTTLAGFKHILEKSESLPIVVAINSDISMKAMNKSDFEPQNMRANKIGKPLAQLFSDRPVVIVFYDETTPNALYHRLNKDKLTKTLHKWGYGTTPVEPKIEGAEYFERTYAFPMPNDEKPLCYYETSKPEHPQPVTVADLRGVLISADNQLLFDLPAELAQYGRSMSKRATPTG